jgi:hypothetical protein
MRGRSEEMGDHCKDCKFFSEMIAESIGCGPITAMCLCGSSKNHGKMVRESNHCEMFIQGTPIDMPE